MYVVYVYNQYNYREVATVERVKQEMNSHLVECQVMTIDEAKEKYPIRTTPCLIPIREDLQGEHLLCEDEETGKFRLFIELIKLVDEEEAVIHDAQSSRIDRIINEEIQTRYKEEKQAYEKTIDHLLLDSLGGGGVV